MGDGVPLPAVELSGRRSLAAGPATVWGRLTIVLRALGSSLRVGETFSIQAPSSGSSPDTDVIGVRVLALETHRRVAVEVLDWRQFRGTIDLVLAGDGQGSQAELLAHCLVPGGWPMRVIMLLFRRRFHALREQLLEYLLFEIEALAANGPQGPLADPRHADSEVLKIYRHAVATESSRG